VTNLPQPRLLSHPESESSFSGPLFSACGKQGFTLIELISVMVVMVLVLTIAVGSHLMWKRHNALDAVEMQVLAHLSLARQHAITQVRPTSFWVTNALERGEYLVSTSAEGAEDMHEAAGAPSEYRTLIGGTNAMPRQLFWRRDLDSPELEPFLTFLPDGSCRTEEDRIFVFWHDLTAPARTNALLHRAIRVNRLTGLARALPREDREDYLKEATP